MIKFHSFWIEGKFSLTFPLLALYTEDYQFNYNVGFLLLSMLCITHFAQQKHRNHFKLYNNQTINIFPCKKWLHTAKGHLYYNNNTADTFISPHLRRLCMCYNFYLKMYFVKKKIQKMKSVSNTIYIIYQVPILKPDAHLDDERLESFL